MIRKIEGEELRKYGFPPKKVKASVFVCDTKPEAFEFINSERVPANFMDYVIAATGETVVIF